MLPERRRAGSTSPTDRLPSSSHFLPSYPGVLSPRLPSLSDGFGSQYGGLSEVGSSGRAFLDVVQSPAIKSPAPHALRSMMPTPPSTLPFLQGSSKDAMFPSTPLTGNPENIPAPSYQPFSSPSLSSRPRFFEAPGTIPQPSTISSSTGNSDVLSLTKTALRRTSQPAAHAPSHSYSEAVDIISSDSDIQETRTPLSASQRQAKGRRSTQPTTKAKKTPLKTTGGSTSRKGGRQPGSRNWTIEEDRRAVTIFSEHLPCSSTEINMCADIYNVWARRNGFPERDGPKLKKRVNKIASTKPPTGCAKVPEHIETARKLEDKIRKRTRTIECDDGKEIESDGADAQYTDSDLTAPEDNVAENDDKTDSKNKGKEKVKVVRVYNQDSNSLRERADWSKSVQTRRASSTTEMKEKLAAYLDPEAREARAAAQDDRRQANALALATITDLQATVRARDAKIDDLYRQVRELERQVLAERETTHATQRALDRAENKLAMQEMLLRLTSSQGADIISRASSDMKGVACLNTRDSSTLYSGSSHQSIGRHSPTPERDDSQDSVKFNVVLTPSKRKHV